MLYLRLRIRMNFHHFLHKSPVPFYRKKAIEMEDKGRKIKFCVYDSLTSSMKRILPLETDTRSDGQKFLSFYRTFITCKISGNHSGECDYGKFMCYCAGVVSYKQTHVSDMLPVSFIRSVSRPPVKIGKPV